MASSQAVVEQERSKEMQVDLEKCNGCGDCLEACSNEAISMVEGKAVIYIDTCLGCGECALACSVGAISQVDLPVPVEPAQARPFMARHAQLIEASESRRLAPWFETVLAFVSREIAPRIADTLIAALERRFTQPARLPATIFQPSSLQGRSGKGKPRRRHRQAGWRRSLL